MTFEKKLKLIGYLQIILYIVLVIFALLMFIFNWKFVANFWIVVFFGSIFCVDLYKQHLLKKRNNNK